MALHAHICLECPLGRGGRKLCLYVGIDEAYGLSPSRSALGVSCQRDLHAFHGQNCAERPLGADMIANVGI